MAQVTGARRPRLLILADGPDSVFSDVGSSLAEKVCHKYEVTRGFTSTPETFAGLSFDLVHVCCWWDSSWTQFGFDPERVLLQIISLRDERTGRLWGAEDVFDRFSAHSAVFLAAGNDIFDRFKYRRPVRRLDIGVDSGYFHPAGRNAAGSVTVRCGYVSGDRSWIGRLGAWLSGHVLHEDADAEERRGFYRTHEVIVATGDDAWSHRAIVEAMASGCFVIVGRHAADLVIPGVSGLVISDEDREIETAIAWCRKDPRSVIEGGCWASDETLVRANWNRIGWHYEGILWGRECSLRPDKRAA